MKNILLLLLVLTLPSVAYAEEPVLESPAWSMELKGGIFTPALDNWSHYYGKKDMAEYAATLAYKVHRRVEIGVGLGMAKDKGLATAPTHSTLTGEVVYKVYPLDVFVLVRGIMDENQWVVPYIGGGWTRMFYRQSIESQGSVRGSVDGYHLRGGLQLSLDNLDESAANNFYKEDGVYHTYFFIEAEWTKAKDKSSSFDLGGTTYMMGLLFEM